MRTLQHPTISQQITVPDDVVDDYTARGWAAPGAPALATPDPLDTMTVPQLRTYAEDHDIDLGTAKLKADIRAAIDQAG